ncbi:MAG: chromate transporter [Clostridiales bacterium]|jgi:chromate transporter|nr:chromate transporter [Clostridiales bacterium]
MIYISLFWSFFQVGLFSVGGGYATLPMIQHEVIEKNGWLTITEFTDLVTISQMTPGPIAINTSTFVGVRIAGLGGAVAATGGCVAPAIVIMLTLAYLYQKYSNMDLIQGTLKGLRPASVALIASAGLSIIIMTLWKTGVFSWRFSDIDVRALAILLLSFIAIRRFKLKTYYVILGAGLAGLLSAIIKI